MDCERVQRSLIAYLDGDMGAEVRRLTDAHLAQCYHCREELDELRNFIDSCRAALVHPAPRNEFETIRRQIAADLVKPREWTMPRLTVGGLLKAMALAAAILLIVHASSPVFAAAKRTLDFDRIVLVQDIDAVLDKESALRPYTPYVGPLRSVSKQASALEQPTSVPESDDQSTEPAKESRNTIFINESIFRRA